MSKLPSLIALVIAASVAVPTSAWPCGNPVSLAGNKAVRELKRAEDQLRAGKYRSLIYYTREHEFLDARLQARAELLETTARMRLRRDAATMAEATTTLRSFRATTPDDPIIQSRLAEALLFDPTEASATEARTLIEDLVTRDVVPDAVGWVIAATVRDRAGDTAGRDVALLRCTKAGKRSPKLPCRVIVP